MKAVSFDLWGTLYRSNPDFKVAQYDLLLEFEEELKGKLPTLDEWIAIKESEKVTTNHLVETQGIHVDRMESFKRMFPTFSENNINEFIDVSNELFLKHRPRKREEFDLVNHLKENDYTCYVSSNTIFVYGDILGKIVADDFGFKKYECNFSDEIGVSKPNSRMFDFILKPQYHIGDNLITDGASEKFGIKHFHINKENNFKDFLEYANI